MKVAFQQRAGSRVQAFRASPKASAMKAAPTQFAGLRRANLLDGESAMAGSLAQVR